MKPLQVSQVAKLSKVTVRTLHHFDALGLVTPSARGANGYRLYSRADLERLQSVLFWRALGFPLEAIGRLLSEGAADRAAALRTQRRHLLQEQARLARLLNSVDAALAATQEGTPMTPKAMFEGFDPHPYEAEAQATWGQTAAWKESKRRTAKYTQADWERFRAEQATHLSAMANALQTGLAPTAPEALAFAEAHRQAIERWFYPCPPAMHRHLGELYVTDERFQAFYEQAAPGLSRWFAEAIAANADRG